MTPTSTLVLRDLNVVRGDIVLAAQVNLNVSAGEIVHIIGPNGTGKTTLLMMLAGLLPAPAAQLVWNDKPAEQWDTLYISCLPGLNRHLTVRENLQFLTALNSDNSNSLEQALSHTGLLEYMDLPVNALSSGQQKRVGLTRLWLAQNEQQLWLLDEPYTALDQHMTRQLNDRLLQHIQRGGRIIMTSHQALDIPCTTFDLTQFIPLESSVILPEIEF